MTTALDISNSEPTLLVASLESLVVYALHNGNCETQRTTKLNCYGLDSMLVSAFISTAQRDGGEINMCLQVLIGTDGNSACWLEDRSQDCQYSLPVGGRAFTSLMEKIAQNGITGDDLIDYV